LITVTFGIAIFLLVSRRWNGVGPVRASAGLLTAERVICNLAAREIWKSLIAAE
jgi:hypothetical protein